MCKRGGLLVAFDLNSHRALVTDADCNSWKCAECAERKAQHWTMRAQIGAREFLAEGVPLDFATMTCHPSLTTWEQTAAVFPDAWGKLHKRLNRRSSVCEYLVTIEQHKDGRLHAHALWTFGVSERWLKDNAAACGLGFQAKIKPLKDPSYAVRYVSKYVSKALPDGTPAHFRRIRVSAGWADVRAPVTEHSDLDWKYVGTNGALLAIYEECERERLTMIDIRTGEVFDDVDLGTIVYA